MEKIKNLKYGNKKYKDRINQVGKLYMKRYSMSQSGNVVGAQSTKC